MNVQHADITKARKLLIVATMVWALIVTVLRATRLPNDFSTEHWFIDYRFGFVKRGLIGTLVSLATAAVREPDERPAGCASQGQLHPADSHPERLPSESALEGAPVQERMEKLFRMMTDRVLWTRGKLAASEVTGGVPGR